MAKTILIINGPNLNLLGQRETAIYGSDTFEELQERCLRNAEDLGMTANWFQSNHEGDIVDAIHKAMNAYDGIIINAAAYTHTSIAIRDALLGINKPCIEVHLSNIYAREEFRHHSFLSDIVQGVICGFGADSYMLALIAMERALASAEQ